jgi:hypothetical protein
MNARDYWNGYVEKHGGPVQTAARLRLPYSSIACICNGTRGIGRDLAKRMAEADSTLDPSILIWVTKTDSSKAA